MIDTTTFKKAMKTAEFSLNKFVAGVKSTATQFDEMVEVFGTMKSVIKQKPDRHWYKRFERRKHK